MKDRRARRCWYCRCAPETLPERFLEKVLKTDGCAVPGTRWGLMGGSPEAGQVRTADVAAIVLAEDLERDLIERARGLQDAIARTLWS